MYQFSIYCESWTWSSFRTRPSGPLFDDAHPSTEKEKVTAVFETGKTHLLPTPRHPRLTPTHERTDDMTLNLTKPRRARRRGGIETTARVSPIIHPSVLLHRPSPHHHRDAPVQRLWRGGHFLKTHIGGLGQVTDGD
ncbi:hypothetical protein SERLA73DRAFT_178378 [Serpula lacrymans var. lacrymans S7.3]|uniref:Uncharacterized protein n=2 Tax=Serpula lacrymans var. lacrymans TaxID=341189 RepID=F8PTL2_SERL3|nr:uncharacterized protein SERLADRAFT_462789 [Serpula lacrymans var. lacrymans S7.9]EGO00540.1 hypothetical protein SERLA73DRAFT_178378 [Serpula lacrymans var. lacrymans S7.3]EGO26099.1 hypothetical protein SERLADRAFT_462789 [Serpula lacrymans var. lacrymans S7.9]